MDIDGTSNLDAVDIDGAVQIDNTVTVGADDQGYDVIFYGDTASSNMTWDTSADDLILNDSTLKIDQDDNVVSLNIDTEADTASVIEIASAATTTGTILNIANADALTTGTGILVESNSSSTGTRKLVNIINDNASATGTTCLYINQDANTYGFYMDAENTTGTAFEIGSDVVTSGKIAQFYSNSDDNTARNLVEIGNDHTSADNAVCLYIKQDGADASIELGGNGSIKFPGTQGASSDANSLDDYEEGTWAAYMTTTGTDYTTSGRNTTGTYTKIGRLVTVTADASITTPSNGTGEFRITGLPFTTNIYATTSSVLFGRVGLDGSKSHYGRAVEDTTTINFHYNITDSNAGSIQAVDLHQTTPYLTFSLSYTVD